MYINFKDICRTFIFLWEVGILSAAYTLHAAIKSTHTYVGTYNQHDAIILQNISKLA